MGIVRDLTDQKFGMLLFRRRLRVDSRRRSVWLADCECGRTAEVVGTRVTSGHVTSCGCKAVNTSDDLVGQTFGRLLVQCCVGSNKSRALVWQCLCDCGKAVDVPGPKLRFGHTKSCGCLSVDTGRHLNLTHGQSNTPTYGVWLAMKARCNNKNADNYVNYGGRGIKVCERWENSFENFLADMGERPEGLTIERKDNDRGYEPGNCIWADKATQNANKRPRKDSIHRKDR